MKLPSGTVTFLFTDVEGSTRLLDELGAEEYAEVLAEHRRILREAFAAHHGVEVDTQGDAFFVAFPTAPGALEAARAIAEGLETGPIRVRMGIHTGTPLVTDEGYVGADVHRAARIAACGHGGQVLVSASTASLLGLDGLHDLGEHRLKDLSAPERIYQLGDDDFPSLTSLHQTNLPVPPTLFLGRELELQEALGLLSREDVRLLTLTGPGGTGKTRLGLQVAGLSSGEYPDGLYWVPLAPLRDPELVLETATRTLGATVDLASHIGSKRMLLFFDNFEHVVEAAGGLSELLVSCPGLTLLVTSREALRLTGEQEYPVPPFAHEEGVGFFLARARSIDPAFEADAAVSEICRRLDDLPLALELAAARVKALTAGQILERLHERLPLLTGGARDLPERQRTLRATIDWSYELLGAEEQRLFPRLSVFNGGCTLETAHAVAGADLDTLQSLVEKSLVRRTEERFWMLETIREYAVEQLEESSEADEARRRHAQHFLALAESANLCTERLEAGERMELVLPEGDNMRGAIDWALAAGDVELAASIVVALEQYWVTTSPYEGARRVDDVLGAGADVAPVLHARLLRVRGGMTFIVGEWDEGTRYHEAALEEFRQLGDKPAVAHMLFRAASEARRRGDSDRAKALCEESLALHPSKMGEAQVLSLLGDLAQGEGRREEALDLFGRSAALAAEIGWRWWQASALLGQAEIAIELGRLDLASRCAREGLELSRGIGDRQWTFFGVSTLAWLAAADADPKRAGRLWGALVAEADRASVGQWEGHTDYYAQRVVSESPEFERGREEGRRLSLDAAVEEALAE